MISTALELCGFGCAVAGAFVLFGLGVALLVACPCLLFLGFAIEGVKVSVTWPRGLRRKPRA